MKTLVIPSIREDSLLEFFEKWHLGDWDNVIVIEDNPERTFKLNLPETRPWHFDVEHYSWKEIKDRLKDDSWIISQRDSAIRCYGFLLAYERKADYIFTLDDDCHPETLPFCGEHINNLKFTPKWTESILGTRTRGIPYQNKGYMNNVVASMGLWTGAPDLNAIQQFTDSPAPEIKIPSYNRILPLGQYCPLCGMNFCIKREMAVASYFPIMGKNSPYHRFDDIWFGVIFKKIADHLGCAISVGSPTIHHTKASNRYKNLISEAPGMEPNEYFWAIIDLIPLKGDSPKKCMIEIGKFLQKEEVPHKDVFEADYLQTVGKAMVVWANLF